MKPKTLLLAAFPPDLRPYSYWKTNSFSLKKKPQFLNGNENKNAKKANDSFKVTQQIRGIMWDCNCGLLSASDGISRLPESLLYLDSMSTFGWT